MRLILERTSHMSWLITKWGSWLSYRLNICSLRNINTWAWTDRNHGSLLLSDSHISVTRWWLVLALWDSLSFNWSVALNLCSLIHNVDVSASLMLLWSWDLLIFLMYMMHSFNLLLLRLLDNCGSESDMLLLNNVFFSQRFFSQLVQLFNRMRRLLFLQLNWLWQIDFMLQLNVMILFGLWLKMLALLHILQLLMSIVTIQWTNICKLILYIFILRNLLWPLITSHLIFMHFLHLLLLIISNKLLLNIGDILLLFLTFVVD